MPGKSSNSVRIFSADPQATEAAVRRWIDQVRLRQPEIVRAIWFGSWVTGTATPGSDVDICLILSASPKPFRDRIPDYLPGPYRVGIDLFPYAVSEFDRLPAENPAWHREILRGRDLF